MLEVLLIFIPFYGLITVGILLRFLNFFQKSFLYDLSKLTFYIIMPAFIMLSIANVDIKKFFQYKFILLYEINTIIIFILSAIISKNIFLLTRAQSGIFGLNCSYPNYGYIGIPLSILAFGNKAALPIALIIFADTIVLLMLTIFFISISNNKLSFLKRLELLIISLLKNPLMLAVIFGTIISFFELRLYISIKNFLNILAGAAIPLALISIGGLLQINNIKYYKFKELGFISIMKLVIHPILITGAFVFFDFQNIIWLKTAILASCLPVASNVFLISNSYNTFQSESAQAITLSTIFSTFSIPIVLYILINFV